MLVSFIFSLIILAPFVLMALVSPAAIPLAILASVGVGFIWFLRLGEVPNE